MGLPLSRRRLITRKGATARSAAPSPSRSQERRFKEARRSGSALQISEIYLEAENITGGRFERIQSVSWGSEELWTGNSVRVTIDRTDSPLVLDADGVQSLTVVFDRDPEGDNLITTYTYRAAGTPGECSFTGAIEP